jgi:hypothetical protein
VFEGTPDLVVTRSTLTGEHLAAFLGSRSKSGRALTQRSPGNIALVKLILASSVWR